MTTGVPDFPTEKSVDRFLEQTGSTLDIVLMKSMDTKSIYGVRVASDDAEVITWATIGPQKPISFYVLDAVFKRSIQDPLASLDNPSLNTRGPSLLQAVFKMSLADAYQEFLTCCYGDDNTSIDALSGDAKGEDATDPEIQESLKDLGAYFVTMRGMKEDSER